MLTAKSFSGTPMVKPVRVSSAYAPTPESHMNGNHGTNGGGSLPNMPPSSLAATGKKMSFIFA